jgi:hypothetical protein
MKHAAQIVNGIVTRVIVGTPEWAASRLGGEWVATDKYGETEVQYCGPGYGYAETFPEKFAPQWVMPSPDPVTGVWSSYPKGAVVAHGGRLWKSTTSLNVWQPGVSAWHDEPEIEGVLPQWVAPTGSHDTYSEGFEVTHNGVHYVSDRENNAWEPGTFDSGWRVFGEEPPVGADWVDTGATVTSQAGQLYYVSAPIATLGLTIGQAIRLGSAETTYASTWAGTDNLMQINPYVAASVGAKVWKWA